MQARYVRRRVMPIAYIQRTRERYADYPPYKWAVNTEAPWTPLPKPIKESRLAPKGPDLKEPRIYHHGYRDADADLDPNCVFPLDRLRELEAAGVLGALVDPAITFVINYSHRKELQERAPKIVAELKAAKADAALLVPVCP